MTGKHKQRIVLNRVKTSYSNGLGAGDWRVSNAALLGSWGKRPMLQSGVEWLQAIKGPGKSVPLLNSRTPEIWNEVQFTGLLFFGYILWKMADHPILLAWRGHWERKVVAIAWTYLHSLGLSDINHKKTRRNWPLASGTKYNSISSEMFQLPVHTPNIAGAFSLFRLQAFPDSPSWHIAPSAYQEHPVYSSMYELVFIYSIDFIMC